MCRPAALGAVALGRILHQPRGSTSARETSNPQWLSILPPEVAGQGLQGNGQLVAQGLCLGEQLLGIDPWQFAGKRKREPAAPSPRNRVRLHFHAPGGAAAYNPLLI